MYAMKRFLSALSLLLALVLCSCGSYNKIQKTTDFTYKYEAAKEYYAQGQYNRAALCLNEVLSMLKGTDRGEESLFLYAMSHFKARGFSAAESAFRKYYESYPRGAYAEQARYYCGLALYNSVPEVKLDQTATFESVTEFQSYLEAYPAGRYAQRAQDLIFELQERLVEKEYLSAKLYYDLGTYFGNCTNGGSNYRACIVTAENAIKDYPYTTRREAFAVLILKAKFDLARQSVESKKEERYHDAIDEYYGFLNEYPESAFLKEAHKLFASASRYTSTQGEGMNEETPAAEEAPAAQSAAKS